MVNKTRLRLVLVGFFMLCNSADHAAEIADPLTGSLRFFAHVQADDLRAQCGDGRDRIRLVYNARYDRQVRSYDLGADGTLSVQIRDGANIARISIDDPIKPWRGGYDGRILDATERTRLASAVFGPLAENSPAGLQLPADRTWWLIAACHDGRFRFDAALYPSAEWDRLAFPAVLRDLDRTDRPWAEPLADAPYYHRDEGPAAFNLSVGRDGLVGMPKLLN